MGSWRDDGTRPRPPGPRDIPAIVEGVDELQGRFERVLFVSTLLESGEWDLHRGPLHEALATAWGLKVGTVRQYAQNIRAAAALTPAARAGLTAHLLGTLARAERMAVRAERHAYSDDEEKPAAAARAGVAAGALLVATVAERAKLLGLVGAGRAAPADGEEGDAGAGMRPIATVRCPACGVGTAADDGAPKHCGGCGKPLPPPTQPLDHEEPKEGTTP